MSSRFRRLAVLSVIMFSSLVSATSIAAVCPITTTMSLNPGGSLLATSLGLLSFKTTVSGFPIDITCTTTLHGSLARAISALSGAQIGSITGVDIGPGAGGVCNPTLGLRSTVVARNLPWQLTYPDYGGPQPPDTALLMQIRSAYFVVEIPPPAYPSGGCGFRGDISTSIEFSGGPPGSSGLLQTFNNVVPLISANGAGCPSSHSLESAFAVTPRQTLILVP